MGADSFAGNTPNAPEFIFWISMKKDFIGRPQSVLNNIAKLLSNQAIKAKQVRVTTLVSMGLIKYLLEKCVGVLELHPGKVV